MAYTDIDDPSAYFTTTLYTGTGSTRSVTNTANAGDFQPDWVWIKARSFGESHMLYDSTRGVTKDLRSDGTNAENTNTTGLTSFDSNGFSTGSMQNVNNNTSTYVGWQWKANGGTTSSNSDGSITSTVQANTEAGFSIVTYTGTGSNATVGHGLGAVPDMVIVKRTPTTDNWGVQLPNVLGSTNALRLNLSDSYGGSNGAGWWNDTSPTSTTVSIGTRSEVNTNTSTYIMYCVKNIQGYSKIGSYIGNNSTNGAFVYLGFKPAFVIVKKSSAGENWKMVDTKRSPFNVMDEVLEPSTSNAESSNQGGGDRIDFVSNGFKCRDGAGQFNGNSTYIYYAIAEHPFVSSKGVPTTAR